MYYNTILNNFPKRSSLDQWCQFGQIQNNFKSSGTFSSGHFIKSKHDSISKPNRQANQIYNKTIHIKDTAEA